MNIRPRKLNVLIAVSSMAIVGLLAGVAFTRTSRPRYTNAASSTPAISCGHGIPAEKCNPELAPERKPLPPINPKPKSPAPMGPQDKLCGRNFFIPQQLAEMRKHFGSISCFGLGDQWILVGNGQQINPATLPPPPTSGGAIVAVESCKPSDSTCLNPDVPHNFSVFTASYPPDPSSGSLEVQTTVNSHLINLTDGECGSFTFNTSTLKWYTTTPTSVTELYSGNNVPAPVAAPPSVPASTALKSPAPHADLASCSKG